MTNPLIQPGTVGTPIPTSMPATTAVQANNNNNPKYTCRSCNENFPNWSQCLSHVRNTEADNDPKLHQLTTTPEGRRELQKICKYVPPSPSSSPSGAVSVGSSISLGSIPSLSATTTPATTPGSTPATTPRGTTPNQPRSATRTAYQLSGPYYYTQISGVSQSTRAPVQVQTSDLWSIDPSQSQQLSGTGLPSQPLHSASWPNTPSSISFSSPRGTATMSHQLPPGLPLPAHQFRGYAPITESNPAHPRHVGLPKAPSSTKIDSDSFPDVHRFTTYGTQGTHASGHENEADRASLSSVSSVSISPESTPQTSPLGSPRRSQRAVLVDPEYQSNAQSSQSSSSMTLKLPVNRFNRTQESGGSEGSDFVEDSSQSNLQYRWDYQNLGHQEEPTSRLSPGTMPHGSMPPPQGGNSEENSCKKDLVLPFATVAATAASSSNVQGFRGAETLLPTDALSAHRNKSKQSARAKMLLTNLPDRPAILVCQFLEIQDISNLTKALF